MVTSSMVGWRALVSSAATGLVLFAACGGDEMTTGGIGQTSGTGAATGGTVAGTGVAATAGTVAAPRAGTGVTPPVGVAGTGTAGRIGGTAGTPPVTGGRSGGTAGAPTGTAGTAVAMAGTGAAGTGAAGTGAAGTGTTTPPVMTPTGPGPTLPPIMGDCPNFMSGGTIMVAGHKSIAITAGAPGKGGPLLFYWHGTGGNAGEAQRTLPAAVRSEIMSMGGIIAAFNGNQSSKMGGDCSGTAAHSKADFNAADVIAACAVKNHGVDSRRIYSTGCSAGGLQTGCMAQVRSSYLAAAAPNSGGVTVSQAWQDKHSPAIMTMHGGSSDMVIIQFSQSSKTLDMSAKTHGSFVVNCDHGGGHCQAPQPLQTAAWQFMKDHPWGFTDSPWKTAFPAGVPNYCKVF